MSLTASSFEKQSTISGILKTSTQPSSSEYELYGLMNARLHDVFPKNQDYIIYPQHEIYLTEIDAKGYPDYAICLWDEGCLRIVGVVEQKPKSKEDFRKQGITTQEAMKHDTTEQESSLTEQDIAGLEVSNTSATDSYAVEENSTAEKSMQRKLKTEPRSWTRFTNYAKYTPQGLWAIGADKESRLFSVYTIGTTWHAFVSEVAGTMVPLKGHCGGDWTNDEFLKFLLRIKKTLPPRPTKKFVQVTLPDDDPGIKLPGKAALIHCDEDGHPYEEPSELASDYKSSTFDSASWATDDASIVAQGAIILDDDQASERRRPLRVPRKRYNCDDDDEDDEANASDDVIATDLGSPRIEHSTNDHQDVRLTPQQASSSPPRHPICCDDASEDFQILNDERRQEQNDSSYVASRSPSVYYETPSRIIEQYPAYNPRSIVDIPSSPTLAGPFLPSTLHSSVRPITDREDAVEPHQLHEDNGTGVVQQGSSMRRVRHQQSAASSGRRRQRLSSGSPPNGPDRKKMRIIKEDVEAETSE